MHGEFEDRENELGELPPAIQRERRENYHPRDVAGVRGVPLDIASNAQSMEAQKNAPIGAPLMLAHVTSTFSARPINARDFVRTGTIVLTLIEGA